jgi:hypothetical protein
MWAILVSAIQATYILESQWLSNTACEGSPDQMYIFHVSDPSSFEKPENESWPAMYSLMVLNDGVLVPPFGVCGLSAITIPNACCFSSLDLTVSGGIASGVNTVIEPTEEWTHMGMIGSNGRTYCHFRANGPQELMGYHSLFYLNDGKCKKHVRCFSNQSFAIYDDESCDGPGQVFAISSNNQNYQNPLMGTFQGSLLSFRNAANTVGWITYAPWTLLVPSLDNWAGKLAVSLQTISIALILSTIGYLGNQFVRTKRFFVLSMLIANFTWLLWVILATVYTYSYFDASIFPIVYGFYRWLLLFATLYTTFNATSFLLLVCKFPDLWNRIMYALLILTHLGLCAGAYLSPFVYYMPSLAGAFPTVSYWDGFESYWIIVMFLWDMLPLFAVIWKLGVNVEKTSFWERMKRTLGNDKVFLFTTYGHIACFVGFIICSTIQSQTSLLFDDRTSFSFRATAPFFQSVHAALICIQMDRMKHIVSNSNNSSESKARQSTVKKSASTAT